MPRPFGRRPAAAPATAPMPAQLTALQGGHVDDGALRQELRRIILEELNAALAA